MPEITRVGYFGEGSLYIEAADVEECLALYRNGSVNTLTGKLESYSGRLVRDQDKAVEILSEAVALIIEECT